MIKDISRTAVDGYLKVVRTPIDAVIARTDGERADSLGVKVDRADAAARGIAGAALRDETLQEDARRRRAAADERLNAIRLRSVAEQRSEAAEIRTEEAEEEAEQRRRQAAEQAESQKKQAAQREKAKKQAAAKRASTRKKTAQKTAAEKKAEADKKAKRDKLAQLETKEAALEKKEKAAATAPSHAASPRQPPRRSACARATTEDSDLTSPAPAWGLSAGRAQTWTEALGAGRLGPPCVG